MSSYPDTLRRLYALAPRGLELGLDRVRAAAQRLGHPERELRAVQIAGTNGKGSVACLVAQAARHAGLRVGLFTSPHLHRFAERVRLDGAEAPDEILGPALERVLALTAGADGIPLTFFEVATLAAFVVFRDAGVDLAVLEVGLGGRLDATSIADPLVSAVVTIGRDHTELLGGSLAEIAAEKAAVARPGRPLVLGRLPDEAREVCLAVAAKQRAPVRLLGRDFPASAPQVLPGAHQVDNAAVAREILASLAVDEPRLRGLDFAKAIAGARWPGRLEPISSRPRIIVDGAHNLEAATALAAELAARGGPVAALVFGAVRGKPAEAMLALLRPLARHVILTRPPLDRGRDPAELAAPGDEIRPAIAAALERARELCPADGTIVCSGSLFLVAEVRRLVLGEPADPLVGL